MYRLNVYTTMFTQCVWRKMTIHKHKHTVTQNENELNPINFNLLIFKQDYFLNSAHSSVLLSLNPILLVLLTLFYFLLTDNEWTEVQNVNLDNWMLNVDLTFWGGHSWLQVDYPVKKSPLILCHKFYELKNLKFFGHQKKSNCWHRTITLQDALIDLKFHDLAKMDISGVSGIHLTLFNPYHFA